MIDYRRFLFYPPPAFRGKNGELTYHFFIETLPYRSGRNTAHYRIRRHVFRNNGTGGYDCPVADVNACHNHRFVACPYIVAYHDVTRLHFPKRPPTYPWLRAEDGRT